MTVSAEERHDAIAPRAAADPAEAHLVARARQNDAAAWETLVRAYEAHVFRLAYLVLRDAAAAEDVAQETFVRAFLSLAQFDETRPLRPWLTRIAVNQARNRRRARGRYRSYLDRLLRRTQPSGDVRGRGEQRLQAAWQSQQLAGAVRQLGDIAQEVIYLRYYLDMSEAEMAEALDVPAGTVKSRLHRALRQLRDVVKQDFPELAEG
ncbi:MAG: sigma-70 family RNA polymerase sigma factor [Anaerolineae bacterium]|nr:sigma-70 family RNA polymerase sigma factor [Anaerolineae bacterium]